ncbi:hypothetical protein ABIF38_008589 [Bradyrhizobium japonicum]|jgi:hypothetical protein|uniref:Uncharacterized protein n=1 Tax=Bradyrhizobium elkanii TaxID=29448 RepID=A0A8I1YJ58_BRAEL|nr:hypothetical protein [Bradyrhizobium elkanii]MCS4007156.1 hypothetical protein [Bradyrhizobium elkanii USDA 61]MBP2428679.1 hypothetical protein [Bradyrhizobium elkanii]MCP1729095.1 hypothetical protein [Bradyrhizobium elkanii]MCP1755837.1 hypothetical protein [Bradyrhizobium elkanii]
MSHAAGDRSEVSIVTEKERELARCRQEIARLKNLVVQLSQLVLRHVAESSEDRKPQSR